MNSIETLQVEVIEEKKMKTYKRTYPSLDKQPLISEEYRQTRSSEQLSNCNPRDYGSTVNGGTSASAEPHVVLRWQNISVFTKTTEGSRWFPRKQKKLFGKQIISNVSGIALPGQLLAIMGSSGAGKTTLLNVLTLRSQDNLDASGTVLINGRTLTPGAMAAISAYVQQDDLFFGMLTVKEQLTFQALLRMDNDVSYHQRMKRVEDVITELGLTKCQNTLIGVPGRVKGISGGEKRRLAFAAEVLTDPPLMFCDEPTSGLDAFMAQNVVATLRGLAAKGKTILCTIHQPSSYQYALFDRIMLMAEGKLAFLGTPEEALDFFSRIQHACPPNYNPADHFIHVLSAVKMNGNENSNEEQRKSVVEKICQSFASSKTVVNLLEESEKLSSVESIDVIPDGSNSSKSGYKASMCKQFRAVMWRSYLCVIREPMLIKMRLYQTLFVAVVLGLVFWGQKLNQRGVTNINGATFLLLTNVTFQNVFAVIHVFCGELPIFLRERWNGMYRTEVYFICKNIAEFPAFVIFPTIMLTVCYWMIGFNPYAVKFFFACVIVVLVANVCVSYGYLVSTISSSISLALAIAPCFILPMLIFGGFFLNVGSIPWYLEWFQYVSWFKYGNEALVINQWSDVRNIECSGLNETCARDGKIVLATLNFHEENLWIDVVMLVVLTVTYRFLALIALFIRAWRKQ